MKKLLFQFFPLLVLVMTPVTQAVAQESRVFTSHPFQLDVQQARPAPFQLFPVDPMTMNNCCAFNFPGWNMNAPWINQWQGIPYRQDLYILDGSIQENNRKVYRAGSVFTGFQIQGSNEQGNQVMVQDRVLVLPGN